MSTYDDASLIYYPSGYKAGTAYSLKPTDGSGDLDFTRASTATRVNADGLIEGVRTNLALYSEDQTNAVYTESNATITGNAVANPLNEAVTADKLVENTANSLHRVGQGAIAVTSGVPINFSFYAKAGERTSLEIQRINTSGTVFNVLTNNIINLTTGVVPSIAGATNYGSVSLGSGWFRYYFTLTPIASGSGGFNLGLVDGSGNVSYTGDGTSGAFIYGFQAQLGDIATDYIPTTTTAVSVGMLANVPRIDYTSGGCGKLLLEPQRTNLFDYSEDFSQWAANAGGISSIEPNYAISPEGVENAYKVNFVVQGDSDLALVEGHSVIGGATYAYSIYIKGEGSDIGKDIVVKSKRSGGDSAGTITTQTLTGEWVRVDFTTTYAANNTATTFRISSNDATSCLIYGAQAELGSYSTSYIPTSGVAVTRVADEASKTGISSLINSTEGVLYAEIAALYYGGNNRAIAISDGTSSNRVLVYYTTTTNQITALYTYSGTTQVSINETLTDSTQFIKFAFKYKENDCAFWINGIKVGTDNTATAFAADTLDSLRFDSGAGSSDFYGKVQNLMVFPSALSDTELLALTTL
jgi:hypothetical protein